MSDSPTPDPQPPDREAIRNHAEELRSAFLSAAGGYGSLSTTGPPDGGTAIERMLDAEQAMFDYVINHYHELDNLDWVDQIHDAHLADLAQAILNARIIPLTNDEIRALAQEFAASQGSIATEHATDPALSDEEALRRGVHQLLDIPEPQTFDEPPAPDIAPGL